MAAQEVAYLIAGLAMKVSFPEALVPAQALPSFRSFMLDTGAASSYICQVELSYNTPDVALHAAQLLSDVSVVWGERFRFYELDDCYVTSIALEQDHGLCIMRSSKDFSAATIFLPNQAYPVHNILSWMIMVAFGQVCLLHGAILIHASVVACREEGFAFLGKSGTGKSTHSRLWLKHIPDTALLNDDNPAIRLMPDGQIYVYGTPWSGKTLCYINRGVQLRALVRLQQAAVNKFDVKSGMEALVAVLPSCTAIRWNKHLFSSMTDTLEAVLKSVVVARLECLPDQAAANLCYQELTNENIENT
jgi:hypothetical protein